MLDQMVKTSLRNNEREGCKTVIANKSDRQVTMMEASESTGETIEFAKAEELGMDFITLLPPSYFKL